MMKRLFEGSFKDFLSATKRGKYMTHGAFMLSLRDHDYWDLVKSVRPGETLRDGAVRWAKKHAPDITIVDDDDGEDHGRDFKIVDDEDEDL